MIEVKQELLTPEMKTKIDKGFSQHALEATGRQGRGDLITFTAYDVSDSENPIFAGTVCVQMYWGQLHIKYVLVEPAYRKRGLGTQLVEQALNYGRKNKCSFALVETMSFQAPQFYQKLGFVLELTRTGFLDGVSFHYLKRDL